MAIPYRGTTSCATYFVTAGTYNKTNLLQSDRMAELFCRTLFHYRDADRLKMHAFVVMPNHVHLLITIPEGTTLERAMQYVKGGFSFHAGKLLNRGNRFGRRVLLTGAYGTLSNAKSIGNTFTRIRSVPGWWNKQKNMLTLRQVFSSSSTSYLSG
jgi:REP element-mobilizing transposase RayT